MPSPENQDASPVILRCDGAIARIQFNRPAALNAVDVATATALRDALARIESNATLRAVVLSGAGRAFAAGGDLAVLRENPVQGAAALLGPLNEAAEIMARLDAPVIAQVHGVAAGAGMSLMLHADFIIAAAGTRLNLAYINLGTNCDVGASWALPRLVGLRHALAIAMLGDAMTAEEAQAMGLINRVVPAEQLQTEVDALALRLAQGPTRALGRMRRLMRESFDRDLPQQLQAEKVAFCECAATEDFRSGVEAFYARKPALFKGC
ncbi:MAG: enoyl-CoA hydratase-related protein [Burkholderiaceae bacterium]|nr:enoyl-CoA hydratase-related protein [Burkholderiaceae bacterium]